MPRGNIWRTICETQDPSWVFEHLQQEPGEKEKTSASQLPDSPSTCIPSPLSVAANLQQLWSVELPPSSQRINQHEDFPETSHFLCRFSIIFTSVPNPTQLSLTPATTGSARGAAYLHQKPTRPRKLKACFSSQCGNDYSGIIHSPSHRASADSYLGCRLFSQWNSWHKFLHRSGEDQLGSPNPSSCSTLLWAPSQTLPRAWAICNFDIYFFKYASNAGISFA